MARFQVYSCRSISRNFLYRLITTKPKSISSRSTGLNNCRRRSSAALFSRSITAGRGKTFYAPSRTSGTLRSVAKHRLVSSPLVDAGNIDITAHVDWTSLCEKAERCGLTTAGFADQHHFITALAATFLPNELSVEDRPALQTLLHPGLLGRTYQFLALAKDFPPAPELAGFKFARDPRSRLVLMS